MEQAIRDLFGRYESETNAALAGKPDMAAISDLYEDAFIGSSAAGVMAGKKDEDFKKALATGFARNRKIGAQRIEVVELRAEEIDAMHALVHVDWRATYDSDGSQKAIDFTNAYLTRLANGRCKVFGWITGDEDAELRRHGII
ncbi:nuclear transport factor 2 family protein [Rhizobium sp. 18055]|uniref:nuclear transport factor 2 family protein n=1 Tax=Rhizobium sp. 18055 TaxID=2681403 RepID=UPI0013578DD3|nr:nuclear transport factor 2 family protein [Rhizobium sp. 18055]